MGELEPVFLLGLPKPTPEQIAKKKLDIALMIPLNFKVAGCCHVKQRSYTVRDPNLVGQSIGVSAAVNGFYVGGVSTNEWVRAAGRCHGIQARIFRQLIRILFMGSKTCSYIIATGEQAGRGIDLLLEAHLHVCLEAQPSFGGLGGSRSGFAREPPAATRSHRQGGSACPVSPIAQDLGLALKKARTKLKLWMMRPSPEASHMSAYIGPSNLGFKL